MSHSLLTGLLFSSLACGASQPAAEPASPAAESAAESTAAEEDQEDAAASSNTEKPAAAQEDAGSGPSFKRTAKDIVTAPDVIFMFSFNESDVRKEAEDRCDKRVKDDPKKRAECMTKEKSKIDSDGMQFLQEKGRWYWITVRRKGNTLVSLHKVPVEFADETDTSIVLKPAGKDEGTQRGRGAPGATKVEVPNDYQIVINDSKHGKMVYEAKVGLVGEQKR